MVKIAIDLWNRIDIRESIVNYRLNGDHRSKWKKWREIEVKVLDKVAQLPITEVLMKDFVSVISPIGVEIKKWWRFHKYGTGLSILPNRFSWTTQVTIDRVKTAECLVKDKNINVDTRYKLASLYCMEDVIPKAWRRLDKEQKQYYYTMVDDRFKKIKFKFLFTFWAYKLKGKASKLDDHHSANCRAFENAVWMGNKMAVEYFLDKLTDEENNIHLVINTMAAAMLHSVMPCHGHYTEIIFYLLSRMSEVQMEMVFEKFPFKMLECFLEWPNRLLFIEMAERTLRTIDDVYHYGELMLMIIEDIANGWSDCTSHQLFHHFWNLCPLSYKRRAIEGIDYYTMMKLYETSEVGIIRALFQHACAEEKKGLIMCRREVDATKTPLWSVFPYIPSMEAMVKFRAEFLETQ